MNIEQIAKVAHEINRAYCAAMGDDSQMPWEFAPQAQRDSIINGVKFSLADPDAPPSANHESWLKQKTAEGWSYGVEKDTAMRKHPCFLPYDQLPAEQRAKDYLFKAVVRNCADLPKPEYFRSKYGIGEIVEMHFGQDFLGQIMGVIFSMDSKTPIYAVRRADGVVVHLSENEICIKGVDDDGDGTSTDDAAAAADDGCEGTDETESATCMSVGGGEGVGCDCDGGCCGTCK